jgi:ribose transport system substrate-binding protein
MNIAFTKTIAAALVAAAIPLAAACGGDDSSSGSDSSSAAGEALTVKASKRLGKTQGPNGETPAGTDELTLTDAEAAKVKSGNYTVAMAWHTSSDWVNAVQAGADAELAELGMKVVAKTDAGYDAAKQKSDLETLSAKKPDVIMSLPVDPVATKSAYRHATERGAKLVLTDNAPDGFKAGKDYVSLVSADLFGMGHRAADILAASLGGKGQVGWIYHDADFYVTNQRDQAFKTTIEGNYPDMKIVAEQGIADPNRAEDVVNAMLTKHPDLDGIYVTWAEPAEGVLSALRNQGNTKTKVVTLDLSEPVALDMVKDGNVAGIAADKAYELGRGLARAAAYGVLGKKAPAFVAAPTLSVTKATVREGWNESLHRDPPKAILDGAR